LQVPGEHRPPAGKLTSRTALTNSVTVPDVPLGAGCAPKATTLDAMRTLKLSSAFVIALIMKARSPGKMHMNVHMPQRMPSWNDNQQTVFHRL
jgi:hypothetical protein